MKTTAKDLNEAEAIVNLEIKDINQETERERGEQEQEMFDY